MDFKIFTLFPAVVLHTYFTKLIFVQLSLVFNTGCLFNFLFSILFLDSVVARGPSQIHVLIGWI